MRTGYRLQSRNTIILANDFSERQFLFRRYVRGTLEPLQSSFDANQLETWIIRLLAQVKQVRKDEVLQLLLNTFGGYLANRQHPAWRSEMENRLKNAFDRHDPPAIGRTRAGQHAVNPASSGLRRITPLLPFGNAVS